ncbi:hypothetical protein [Roseibium sp.]|uniref:hypothetical protein n=1 Tax=Roseibium sp. TaxID=1936156 RepID=UPI0032643A71
MGNYLTDTLLPALADDTRIEAIAADADDLVLQIGGDLLRMTQDAEHGRTVFWTDVRILKPGEIGGGAATARRYNDTRQTRTGLTMGFHLKGNALILGRSVDERDPDPERTVALALAMRDGLADARTLLDKVLEETRREEDETQRASWDGPLMSA